MRRKRFPLGAILELITSRRMPETSQLSVDSLDQFLNSVTGRSTKRDLTTRMELLRQHPQLWVIVANQINPTNVETWFATQISRFGETLPVSPIVPKQLGNLVVNEYQLAGGEPTLLDHIDIILRRVTSSKKEQWQIIESGCALCRNGEWVSVSKGDAKSKRLEESKFKSAQEALDFWNSGHLFSRFEVQPLP